MTTITIEIDQDDVSIDDLDEYAKSVKNGLVLTAVGIEPPDVSVTVEHDGVVGRDTDAGSGVDS